MKQSFFIEQRFEVKFQFKLHFTSHLFDNKNQLLAQVISGNATSQTKALFVIDEGLYSHHTTLINQIEDYFNANPVAKIAEILVVPGGELAKNSTILIDDLLQKVNTHAIDRHSYMVAIGGGAVLDAVGYAAAIAHRGVRLIRIPTTVLSQNDSGIGVKNGINYFNKKNFVGTFTLPYAVINDDQFLGTLCQRDWRAGISEAIKVALIKDLPFFEWIENHAQDLVDRDLDAMNYLIQRCAELHMAHIRTSGDPFELGSSRPLDFGHWSAHKLEQLTNFDVVHGEAVAMGIALDSRYSHLKGWLELDELNRILNCIKTLGFEWSHPKFNQDILKGLEEFREHLGGKLTIMLLKGLGQGFEVNEIDYQLMLNAMQKLTVVPAKTQ